MEKKISLEEKNVILEKKTESERKGNVFYF